MRFSSLKPSSLREIISCITELRGIAPRRDEATLEWCQLRQSEREVGIFDRKLEGSHSLFRFLVNIKNKNKHILKMLELNLSIEIEWTQKIIIYLEIMKVYATLKPYMVEPTSAVYQISPSQRPFE